MGFIIPQNKECWLCVFYNAHFGICDMPAFDKVNNSCSVYAANKIENFRREQKLRSAAIYGNSVTK